MPQTHAVVVRNFRGRLTTAIDHHRELLIAIHLKKREQALATMLAEQFVLSTTVLWEVFLSELLVTYLHESPEGYLISLKRRMLQSAADRYGSGAAKYTRVAFPKKVSRALASTLADPKDFNVTVKSADALASRANEMLAAESARKFTLVADDAQFLEFGIAIRNYLSHRSRASRETLKATIHSLGGPNADLAGPFPNVGAYLKQKNPGGDTRALVVANRFVELANKLG